MTLGLEAIKFLLEQDEANVPIVQDWIDKWFWRGYRLLGLVAADAGLHAAPEGDELEGVLRALLRGADARRAVPGPRVLRHPPPRHVEQASPRRSILSHQVYWTLYQFQLRRGVHHDRARRRGAWTGCREKYPETFDQYFRPLWDKGSEDAGGRRPFFFRGLPQLCQVCQIPMVFTEPGDPTTPCQRHSELRRASATTPAPTAASGSSSGSPRSTSRRGCRCTRSTRATAAEPPFPRCWPGTACRTVTRGEYLRSADKAYWDKWHAEASSPAPTPVAGEGWRQGALRLLLPGQDRQEHFGDDLLVNVCGQETC